MTPELCEHCTLEIPLDWRYCPHCCYRLLCPNVRKAKDPAEKGALELRYQAAVADADSRGAATVVREFESHVLAAKAVMGSA